MYSIGKKYKFEIKKGNGIFYTGFVLEEDSLNVRIKTIRNEELILSKKDILQSRMLNSEVGIGFGIKSNRKGDFDGKIE